MKRESMSCSKVKRPCGQTGLHSPRRSAPDRDRLTRLRRLSRSGCHRDFFRPFRIPCSKRAHRGTKNETDGESRVTSEALTRLWAERVTKAVDRSFYNGGSSSIGSSSVLWGDTNKHCVTRAKHIKTFHFMIFVYINLNKIHLNIITNWIFQT